MGAVVVITRTTITSPVSHSTILTWGSLLLEMSLLQHIPVKISRPKPSA